MPLRGDKICLIRKQIKYLDVLKSLSIIRGYLFFKSFQNVIDDKWWRAILYLFLAFG